jgi:hypothetical protein
VGMLLPPFISAVLRPNIVVSALFSNTMHPCSLNMRYNVIVLFRVSVKDLHTFKTNTYAGFGVHLFVAAATNDWFGVLIFLSSVGSKCDHGPHLRNPQRADQDLVFANAPFSARIPLPRVNIYLAG